MWSVVVITKSYYNSNTATQAGLTAWTDGPCYVTTCPDPHKIIAYIKEHNKCDESPYTLYKVKYKGRPAYFLDGVARTDYVDQASDLIYDCEGTIIASNGYVTEDFFLDYNKISHKERIYECDQECSDIESVVYSLREKYSSWCDSGNKCKVKIYSALYQNIPAVYVELQCDDLLDVGGGVYNCKGDLIAGASFGSSPPINLNYLDIIDIKWKCADSETCYDLKEDFEDYNTHYKFFSVRKLDYLEFV